MDKKNTIRNLKVYEQGGYNYKSTPTIMLKGQWLRELGFEANTPISVQCENGKLTIVPREPEEERIITTIIRNGVTTVAEDRVVYK